MKWLFRIIGFVFLVFGGLCTVGFFQPSVLIVERSSLFAADPEDIFPLINDLERHPDWSPWMGEAAFVYGGAPEGPGMTMVWKARSDAGSSGNFTGAVSGRQDITANAFPDFVKARLQVGEHRMGVTYALSITEAEDTVVLINIEQDMGGFPYVQRLRAWSLRTTRATELEHALDSLQRLSQQEGL